MWGLNAMYGRKDNNGDWDSTNAVELLKFFHSIKAPLHAVTLGNEVWGLMVNLKIEQAIASFMELDRVVTEIWSGSKMRRPLIAGFDGYIIKSQFDFIDAVLGNLSDSGVQFDVLNYHDYPLWSSNDPNVVKRAMLHNPNKIDQALQYHKVASQSYTPPPQVWMSECGGSYNSGSPQATGTFASGFWYLDNMAMMHHAGHRHFCRQTLAGGNYGLLDQVSPRTPHPDFWSAVLYQRILGGPAELPSSTLSMLGAMIYKDDYGNLVQPSSKEDFAEPRWYIYHAKRPEASLAVLGINFDEKKTCGFRLNAGKIQIRAYTLTPLSGLAPWNSTGITLNGLPLLVDGDGRVPSLEGNVLIDDTLWLAPLTYAFFELPAAATGTKEASISTL